MVHSKRIGSTSALACIALLAACSLAPKYQRPDVAAAKNYKEAAGDWIAAKPESANSDRGPWWHSYQDADLNALEDKVTAANQDLKAALARYEEARAGAAVARAGYFPTITANTGGSRNQLSQTVADPSPVNHYSDFSVGADVSYELDVWGRVRNTVIAGESRAQASASDLAAMDLSLHAELAMDYFALRGDDAAQTLLDETVVAYKKALDLTKARHDGGVAAESDVDQAETQYENAKTMAADTRLKRAQLEHAIAVLIGETPSSFSLTAKQDKIPLAPIIPGLPSTLIEQRPDIAAAEQRVQAANADIGVARAAFYPDFTLSAAGGFESALLPKLLDAPSLFWSLGPSAALTVFDGGRISALSDQAHAAYDESVANYRQTVLTAFQQVEDNLAALRELAQENTTQSAAATASERALAQEKDRYTGGIVTYLNVVIAQNTALQAELGEIDVRTRQLTASVLLIKALGGGWHPDAIVVKK